MTEADSKTRLKTARGHLDYISLQKALQPVKQ